MPRRNLHVFKYHGGENSLSDWWRYKNPLVVTFNFIIIELCKYLPSLAVKRFLLRFTGMRIGKGVSFGLGVQLDIFYPERITIGDGSIIGYDALILCHEFLIDSLRVGDVEIGKKVMVGTRTTILPGVHIGDKATIGACSLVNRDVKAGDSVGGIPIKRIRR